MSLNLHQVPRAELQDLHANMHTAAHRWSREHVPGATTGWWNEEIGPANLFKHGVFSVTEEIAKRKDALIAHPDQAAHSNSQTLHNWAQEQGFVTGFWNHEIMLQPDGWHAGVICVRQDVGSLLHLPGHQGRLALHRWASTYINDSPYRTAVPIYFGEHNGASSTLVFAFNA